MPLNSEVSDFTLLRPSSGENMGRFDRSDRFDRGQQKAAELAAYQALWNLWHTSRRAAVDISNWESACEMLQTYYTVAQARQDSEVCAMRIRYLQISEPIPRLADFVPAPPHRVPDAPRQLAQASFEFRLARQRHPERERQRLKELETTKVLYQAVKSAEARAEAAELARRREWQQSRWPKGVVLDSEIYNTDGIAAQVEMQNAKIDSETAALTNLLREGLQSLDSEITASYRAGDAAGIAANAVSALTAMPLPRCITPKAKAAYSPDACQLVVEFDLPNVDVVPKAKSFRYVKSRETVVATARPVMQVKALYASIIGQLTLLAVASILERDSEQHIGAVVFNGFVDGVAAADPQSGQPIRPCLIAVRVTREALADIDLRDVDPSACLGRLSATVSGNPTDLVSVRPLA
jgi:restriction system protein